MCVKVLKSDDPQLHQNSLRSSLNAKLMGFLIRKGETHFSGNPIATIPSPIPLKNGTGFLDLCLASWVNILKVGVR